MLSRIPDNTVKEGWEVLLSPSFFLGIVMKKLKKKKLLKTTSTPAHKIRTVMREFEKGKLKSGKSGKIVTDAKQAMAIALSESKKLKKRKKKV